MYKLRDAVARTANAANRLPFSVITSIADQHIRNVPIIKPLLICILGGRKELGRATTTCGEGEFIFLSNTHRVDMRNLSQQGTGYFSLLLEFEYGDFSEFDTLAGEPCDFFSGPISPLLELTLTQFVELSASAPESLWAHRRREILQVFYHLGYTQVSRISEPPGLTTKVEEIISKDLASELGAEQVAKQLAMSDSSMRRKLSAEGTGFQAIKDRIKLGHGLYMLQTTALSVGQVAHACGYQSQSRFTDKFKDLYGLTPTQLRKTRFKD